MLLIGILLTLILLMILTVIWLVGLMPIHGFAICPLMGNPPPAELAPLSNSLGQEQKLIYIGVSLVVASLLGFSVTLLFVGNPTQALQVNIFYASSVLLLQLWREWKVRWPDRMLGRLALALSVLCLTGASIFLVGYSILN
jgi:hypothetical protein